ncbi:MAG: exodeoxyribonuclease VII small subunit [Gammaproteobacteria bacterium RIFCSPHIGHO2_12_FULL_43_28]|nr:MAG: exodeoxyribonuclease VII small subunit [Gammaproteobacteria bacterium RIFCSPHIGHO2_12_FULL_43_28]
MKKISKLPSLEASFTEVSTLIDKMEHGELTLEQSLQHFERGIVLIKHCQKLLNEAEQKVQVLIEANNQAELAPYGDDKTEGTEKNENQE